MSVCVGCETYSIVPVAAASQSSVNTFGTHPPWPDLHTTLSLSLRLAGLVNCDGCKHARGRESESECPTRPASCGHDATARNATHKGNTVKACAPLAPERAQERTRDDATQNCAACSPGKGKRPTNERTSMVGKLARWPGGIDDKEKEKQTRKHHHMHQTRPTHPIMREGRGAAAT